MSEDKTIYVDTSPEAEERAKSYGDQYIGTARGTAADRQLLAAGLRLLLKNVDKYVGTPGAYTEFGLNVTIKDGKVFTLAAPDTPTLKPGS